MAKPYTHRQGLTGQACYIVTALTLAAVLIVVDVWLVASVTLKLWGVA